MVIDGHIGRASEMKKKAEEKYEEVRATASPSALVGVRATSLRPLSCYSLTTDARGEEASVFWCISNMS